MYLPRLAVCVLLSPLQSLIALPGCLLAFPSCVSLYVICPCFALSADWKSPLFRAGKTGPRLRTVTVVHVHSQCTRCALLSSPPIEAYTLQASASLVSPAVLGCVSSSRDGCVQDCSKEVKGVNSMTAGDSDSRICLQPTHELCAREARELWLGFKGQTNKD